ncbi:UNVERIFIED_CONTAM: hypothetical protein Slati_2915000 [Sesamum latifolium]|uniref:Reverse transcriptase zinc-binding domain-containing protein n=1 Tax=Sesamum latifolium TaxID=2727402 RepID=A0AAW2VDX1_9LAMI
MLCSSHGTSLVPTADHIPAAPCSASLTADCKVVALISPADGWNEVLIRAEFCSEDADCILGIKLRATVSSDELVWHYESRGMFSVKSAYSLAVDLNSEGSCSQTGRAWKYLWKAKVLPKIAVFAWRCVNNALPTNANLKRRGSQFLMATSPALRISRTLFMSFILYLCSLGLGSVWFAVVCFECVH